VVVHYQESHLQVGMNLAIGQLNLCPDKHLPAPLIRHFGYRHPEFVMGWLVAFHPDQP
jgi:hypothetical protein